MENPNDHPGAAGATEKELEGDPGANSSSQTPRRPQNPGLQNPGKSSLAKSVRADGVPAHVTLKIRALNQFVHDYLSELGLSEQARLWKEYVKGPTFPPESTVEGIPFFIAWDRVFTNFSDCSSVIIERGSIGTIVKPILPAPPPGQAPGNAKIKIQGFNQLVFQWLKELGFSHVADAFKAYVKELVNFQQFIQINFVRDWLQIMLPISFEGCAWGELGPMLPSPRSSTESSIKWLKRNETTAVPHSTTTTVPHFTAPPDYFGSDWEFDPLNTNPICTDDTIIFDDAFGESDCKIDVPILNWDKPSEPFPYLL